MDDPKSVLVYALETYPERVEIAPLDQLLMDSARESGKRSAYVKLAVPDDMVKSLRGRQEQEDVFLLIKVPKDVKGRAESPIILPNEV